MTSETSPESEVLSSRCISQFRLISTTHTSFIRAEYQCNKGEEPAAGGQSVGSCSGRLCLRVDAVGGSVGGSVCGWMQWAALKRHRSGAHLQMQGTARLTAQQRLHAFESEVQYTQLSTDEAIRGV
jgi:hypothetical protein